MRRCYRWLLVLWLIVQLGQIQAQTDFRKETIYFLITTRFFDGDPSNNRPTEWSSYGANSPAITDPNDVTWRGDFKGLIQKLDYIKDLGFTAIWITPIVQNRGPLDYHGYHAWDFTKVDPRLESPGATFQDLINEVHARGMKIVLDIVTNHSGRFGIKGKAELKYNTDPTKSWYAPDNANWQYDGLTPNPQDGKIWSRANLAKMPAPYNSNLANYNWPCTESFVNTSDPNWFHHSGNGFAQGWDDTVNLYERALAGDCPDLNTSSQQVRDYLVAAYTTFINMGVDAFRWDTMKHMSKEDVLYFMDKFKAVNPNLFVFGEVAQKRHELHTVEEINPHWYTWRGAVGSSANSGIAVLDFYAEATFHNIFQDGGNFSGVTAAARYDHLYSDPSTLLTWLDNHDFGPNNDWNQRYGGSAENLAACMNFMFTWRGIPVVYYGTEIQFKKGVYADIHDASGISQSIDQTGRAYYGAEFANAPNHKIYQHIKKLNAMRKAIPALQNGTWNWAGSSSGNGVGYTRKSGTSEVAVGLAKDGAVTFNFTGLTNGTYRDAVTGSVATVSNGSLSFTVQPSSAGVYVLNGPGIIGGNGVGFFQAGPGGGTNPVVNASPAGGNYENAVNVTLSAVAQNNPVKIYYTTNESTPSASSTLYTGPITVSATTTVKAIAIDSQNLQSEVLTNTYTIGPIPGLKVYFKKPTTWNGPIKVYYWNTLPSGVIPTTNWPGADMTLDPVSGWHTYTFANVTSTNLIFNDNGSTTNKTADLTRSSIGWYKDGVWYTSNPEASNTAPVVTVNPPGPYYGTSAVNVTISSTDDSGVTPTLYYTVDGSTPTTSSLSASGIKSLTIASTTTLKVFAVDNLALASSTQSHTYTITPVNTAPVVSVSPAGPMTSATTVSITISGTDDSGVAPTLYYTLDGTTPTTSSTSAVAPKSFSIATSTTLKVFATDSQGLQSAVQTHVYTINPSAGFTVYFRKPASWSTPVKIHHWNALPAGSLTATTWPGANTTSDGGDWYKFEFPAGVTSTSLLFNANGSTTVKTIDLTRSRNGWYVDGVWYDTDPRPGLRIHLKTTWANPKIHYWNVQPAGTAASPWPGATMVSEGNSWFVFTIPNASCASIVFSNNGSPQTSDLTRCGEGWYDNGVWSSSAPGGSGARIEYTEPAVSVEQEFVTLEQNYPNPASNVTSIRYTIPRAVKVSLVLFNDKGGEVDVLEDSEKEAGSYEYILETSPMKPGLYLYQIRAGGEIKTRKMVILK